MRKLIFGLLESYSMVWVLSMNCCSFSYSILIYAPCSVRSAYIIFLFLFNSRLMKINIHRAAKASHLSPAILAGLQICNVVRTIILSRWTNLMETCSIEAPTHLHEIHTSQIVCFFLVFRLSLKLKSLFWYTVCHHWWTVVVTMQWCKCTYRSQF